MIRHLKIVTLLVGLAGFAAAAGIYQLGFEYWPPRAVLADGSTVPLRPADVQTCFKVEIISMFPNYAAQTYWYTCRQHLIVYHTLGAFELRVFGVIGLGLIGMLAIAAFALCLRFEQPAAHVIRGARLLTGRSGLKAFASACAQEAKLHGRGIELLPPHAIGCERESRHFLILGSVGAGKTQTMLHLIIEAIARNDGVLVLDTKGDMTAGLPAHPEPLLVAPHDKRSLVWDVAADCRVKQDARELAARFIPPSSDPMWSEAAQEIFVACVVRLQRTKGTNWTWADLEFTVNADVETLRGHAENHNPTALRLLNQPESRTTLSILTTFQTHMRVVSVLAEAWRDPSAGRFSIREWLHNPPLRRPLILQQDPGYPELSRIWIGSLLGLLASAVGSPALSESRDRRVWLFLDEFPQLPPIRQFPTFLELGRSKGIVVVIGAQDTAQIRAAYGPDQAKSWFGMIGTKVMTRINASEAAEDVSRLIGDQEIERRIKSVTRAAGRTNVTYSALHETRRVITASEIASRLGPTKKGVRVLFLGLADTVCELELPYITLPKFRDPTIPADWTRAAPSPSGPDKKLNDNRPAVLTKDLANRIRKTRH